MREICGGLAASEGKLRHLGLPDAPKRSTLAYANEHRPWQLYRSVFYQLLGRCREVAGAHGFRFKNKLLTLDATLIELCASVFDWAQYRRTKGAVKLHLLLDHQGLLPSFALITEGRVHESRVARTLALRARNHRGLRSWLHRLRLVRRARCRGRVLRHPHEGQRRLRRAWSAARSLNAAPSGATRSSSSTKRPAAANCDLFLRRIEVWDEAQQRTLVFLTNHRRFAASTIAAIYRQRWQIELFFKALKQNLRIKTFVGTSPNALQIQIWTALIALLLLKYLQLRARFGWSLSNLAALLRQQLFVYRDLFAWIDQPFQPPPLLDPPRRANAAFLVSLTWTAECQPQPANPTTETRNAPFSPLPHLHSG